MDAQRQAVEVLGKLNVDDPECAGLIRAVTDYTNIYSRGCTPPLQHQLARSWTTTFAFHNKTTVLDAHNATISTAAKWLDDMNNQTLYG